MDKSRLWIPTVIGATGLNVLCIVSTFIGIRSPGVNFVEGNPIQGAIISVSPWLTILTPVVMLAVVYGFYKWNRDGGLVLAGIWLGAGIADFSTHIVTFLI